MRFGVRISGLVAGLLLCAVPASAQALWPGGPGSTTPLVPGQLFVGFGAEIGVHHLPKFDNPWRSTTFTGAEILHPSIDPDPTVAGPGGVFGYVFRDGTFPAWAGKKVRLSFGGQFWQGNFTDLRVHPAAPVFETIAPIDGSPGSRANTGYASSSANFNVDLSGYELSMRLASDVDVSPGVTLTPFIALFGGQSRQSFSVRAHAFNAAIDGGEYSLDERIASSRFGGLVGAGLTYRATPRVSLHLGARAGFVWLRSSMTGGDCYSGFVTNALGSTCGSAIPHAGRFQTRVSDTRSTVGFRGGLTGGVSVDLTFALLSLTGFMSYDSAVPGISNPVVTSLALGNNNQPTSGRAHLFFDDAVDFGGMVVVRIPLDTPHG